MTSPGESSILTIEASLWLHVTDNSECVLEGPAFDKKDNLYFVDVNGMGRVFKANISSKEIEVIYDDGHTPFAAVKIHKDGRLFLCGYSAGTIIIITPDGALLNVIRTTVKGLSLIPDDMIFDEKGDFYFTSYDSQSVTGGLYRISADLADMDLIVELDHANGVSLSPDCKFLWVSETHKRVIRRFDLGERGRVIAEESGLYHILDNEPGYPDSNQVDSKGSLYQAMFDGARLVVFNEGGEHIANVVLPEKDRDGYGRTTNVSFQPGTNLGFITTAGNRGGRIYTFKALAKGHLLYSHC